MEIFECESFDELDGLRIEWNQLLSKSLDNNPFSTYEWLTTWWKHFGDERKLRLYVARKGDETLLIAPMMYSAYRVLGIKLRKLEFIATPTSDYQVFLITNFNHAAKAARFLIENARDNSVGADCIEFEEVPESSYTAKILENIEIRNSKTTNALVNLCPYIKLPSSFDALLQTLGPNMRRNLGRWERHARREVKVEFVSHNRFGTVEEAMECFFRLHQKRWSSKNEPGVFSEYANRSFHLDLAKVFAGRGWLILSFLILDDEPVSAIYGYEYNRKLYAYLTGFDPEYARYHPGHLAFKFLIKESIERRLEEFDFMRGIEEYKNWWNADSRRNLEFRIVKGGIKARLYNCLTTSRHLSNLCRKIGEKMRIDPL